MTDGRSDTDNDGEGEITGAATATGTDATTEPAIPRRHAPPLIWTLCMAAGVGVAATLIYALQEDRILTVLGSAVIFAGAAAAGGGLMGLLFGVPRTTGIDRAAAQAGPAGSATQPILPGVGPNTNLEQISDWLTKIIVGVTLTQLATIRSGAVRLFNAMAPSLGGAPVGAAFAGALVVYFSILGFLSGWLWARLRLGAAMSNADALLTLANRAERAGDTATAKAAREALQATVAPTVQWETSVPEDIGELADRYEELRATMGGGPRRTALMDELVRRVKESARTAGYSPEDVRRLFQIGTDGRRIVALGLMEGDVSLADIGSVLDAITNSRSAFEQYQALVVANLILSSLSRTDRQSLSGAIADPAVTEKMKGDASRVGLVQRIQHRLEEPDDTGEPRSGDAGPARS